MRVPGRGAAVTFFTHLVYEEAVCDLEDLLSKFAHTIRPSGASFRDFTVLVDGKPFDALEVDT